MFDFGVGYSEMFLLALVAVIVIGPKDLPKVLRYLGRMMAKMRRMASEFQGHVDVAMKEAGMEDIKKDFQALRGTGNPLATTLAPPPLTAKPAATDAGSASESKTASVGKPAVRSDDFDALFETPAAPVSPDQKVKS